jgi:tetratricopeptide (TPR) repeat protein
MAARPLNEAVQQAEEAISGGNYRLAVETCRRVLGQFPEFATAHRLLAEAYLEQGDAAAAERAFQETLQRDPQSSAAYAGLATLAEGRGDINGALAYAQVAWEINPQRADLRDRVAGLSERLYGKGGRLHLTRAALTSLHFRAGRWSRAAAEAASVLAEHPTRVDVQLRMAEALWRRGSLSAAANAGRAVLESSPSAVMAVLMLADVERRQGNQEAATQLLDRARAIDPDGVRAADLVTIGETDLAEFMLPARMPEFDDSADVTAEVERPRIAPAPDFSWSQPAETEQPVEADRFVTEASLAPAAPETVDEEDFDVSLPDDAEIDAARPPDRAAHGYTSMLESLHDEGLTPFRLEGEEGDETTEEFAASAEDTGDDDVFSLVSDEEIDAARPPEERPHGYTTLLNSLGESGLAPFEVEGAPGYPTEPSEPSEPTAEMEVPADAADSGDYGTDLTAGWDDIDAEIQRATPSGEASMAGFTGALRDLDEIGVQPFSIEGVDESESSGTEFADEVELDASYGDDLSFLDTAPEADQARLDQERPVPMDVDLTDGWATIDEEIQNAIPAETPPGYTDELNELTESGVEPFFVDGGEAEPSVEADVDDESSVYTSDESVSDDLVSGIDLWTFEDEAGVSPSGLAAESAADETVEPTDETVSEADLFDFADLGMSDVAEAEQTEASPTSEWDSAGLSEEPAGVNEAMAASLVEPVAEDVVVEHLAASGSQSEDAVRSALMHLGADASLFVRAREAKAQLVESGQIQGDVLLPGVEPPGPTLEMLEQMVQENPDDQDLRRQLVGALLDDGAFDRAFAEYRWMFRQRLSFNDDDLSNLARVAESGGEQQVPGHRLLGAVYRRSGNLGMSARHYRMSLEGSVHDGGKEA